MSADRTRSPGRQVRRAQRQNEARQADYAARLARWRQVEAQLAQAERAAGKWFGQPLTTRPGFPPLDLERDEQVLAVVPALTLVEVCRAPGAARAGYAGYAARTAAELWHRRPARPAESQRVLGHGPVTVTDRRAVFHGPKHLVEWPFAELVRVEHATTRPVSLLHVAGRRKVTGLLSRGQDAGHLRLVLELAVAGHRGDLRDVLAGLAAERRQHAQDRPEPPAPVLPRQAPGPGTRLARAARAVYVGRPQQRVGWRLAQGLAAALVTLYAVGLAVPDRSRAVTVTGLAVATRSQPSQPAPSAERVRALPEAHRAPAPDPATPPPPRGAPDQSAGTAAAGTPVPRQPAAPTSCTASRASRHTTIGRPAASAR
jgi:hypothetical protein